MKEQRSVWGKVVPDHRELVINVQVQNFSMIGLLDSGLVMFYKLY